MIASSQADNLNTSTAQPEDELLEVTLRPSKLSEYIGQEKLKNNLSVVIEAAKGRGEQLEHVLLYGPPGLGKTTLASIIAKQLGVNMKTTSGPAIQRAGDLAAILTNLQNGDVLFIDEIHRLNRVVEEILYPAMEDKALDIVIGKGPGARSIRMDLPNFTLIGATTRIGLLTGPLRDRFGMLYHLDYYETSEMEQILQRSASILGAKLDKDASVILAGRSRLTPRIANRLLKRVRDFAQVGGHDIINQTLTENALKLLDIDSLGLDKNDRGLMLTIIEKFQGGPVGLSTLAAATSEDEETISEVYEPFLLRLGLITRSPKGRVATSLAYKHFGKTLPNHLL